jgi:alpha-glucosidase (family GH31 glycosyl hydrolase)
VRDEEILMRWIEMNTFSDAVFRTHPSSNPAGNAQVWDNAEIASFFKNFTEHFVALKDYRMGLMQEMNQTGLPITRSLMFELDDTTIDIDDQFFLVS